MDTALITFMVQTSPYTQSVHLIGSWDNFSKHYTMEHDTKRARGQWRGCYAFTDIICDGDGANGSKRTGGLKMGATYYYYYELDNGTEVHDPSVPFTTSCPYLPGQPVNLLQVPVEVQPIRLRSASVNSLSAIEIMTMNPADKFVAPRPPPPPPTTTRTSKTSPSQVSPKRPARSVSPRSDRSIRTFFGLRLPQESTHRGRSVSLGRTVGEKYNSRSSSPRQNTSVPHSRNASPQSLGVRRHTNPQERIPIVSQSSSRHTGLFTMDALDIPDEIVEEGEEDDDNFAGQLSPHSSYEGDVFTHLSPPPTPLRSPTPRRAKTSTSKPLPGLPESCLVPQPLRLRAFAFEANLPKSHFSTSTEASFNMPRSHFSTSTVSSTSLEARSHFSTSTIATQIGSPSLAKFIFHDTEEEEEDGLVADSEESGDDFTYSPPSEASDGREFSCYSLLEDECSSQQSFQKGSSHSSLSPNSRLTFGGALTAGMLDSAKMTSLEDLMSEVGYLHSVIGGN
ncbi:hypothetical protein HYALB_00001050, partial [Hymenoscyphus albidus]